MIVQKMAKYMVVLNPFEDLSSKYSTQLKELVHAIWHTPAPSSSSSLSSSKTKEWFSDVTLSSKDGALFGCHRAILMSKWSYFKGLVESGMQVMNGSESHLTTCGD